MLSGKQGGSNAEAKLTLEPVKHHDAMKLDAVKSDDCGEDEAAFLESSVSSGTPLDMSAVNEERDADVEEASITEPQSRDATEAVVSKGNGAEGSEDEEDDAEIDAMMMS